jgi:hypothetical protein
MPSRHRVAFSVDRLVGAEQVSLGGQKEED